MIVNTMISGRSVKKLILGVFVVTIMTTPLTSDRVHAHGDEHDQVISDVVRELLDTYDKTVISDLSCDDITDQEWEELGEAVMNTIHPDTDQHEAMDEMMGGEGSETLEQAHVYMGKSYLGCSSERYGMMGMMGGFNMMGLNNVDNNNDSDGGGMMDSLYHMGYGTSSWGLFGAALLWLTVFVGVFFLVRTLATGKLGLGSNKSALDILKERYAKGEIEKERFEKMKREITETP